MFIVSCSFLIVVLVSVDKFYLKIKPNTKDILLLKRIQKNNLCFIEVGFFPPSVGP